MDSPYEYDALAGGSDWADDAPMNPVDLSGPRMGGYDVYAADLAQMPRMGGGAARVDPRSEGGYDVYRVRPSAPAAVGETVLRGGAARRKSRRSRKSRSRSRDGRKGRKLSRSNKSKSRNRGSKRSKSRRSKSRSHRSKSRRSKSRGRRSKSRSRERRGGEAPVAPATLAPSATEAMVMNPFTGRQIRVGGQTHLAVLQALNRA